MFKSLLHKISYAALTCTAICGLSSTGFAGYASGGAMYLSATLPASCTEIGLYNDAAASSSNTQSSAISLENVVKDSKPTAIGYVSATCAISTSYYYTMGQPGTDVSSFNLSDGSGNNIVMSKFDAEFGGQAITSAAKRSNASGNAEIAKLTFTADAAITGSEVSGTYNGNTVIYINF